LAFHGNAWRSTSPSSSDETLPCGAIAFYLGNPDAAAKRSKAKRGDAMLRRWTSQARRNLDELIDYVFTVISSS
jgi:hypothetical protein